MEEPKEMRNLPIPATGGFALRVQAAIEPGPTSPDRSNAGREEKLGTMTSEER
jgi:hypothetical protein